MSNSCRREMARLTVLSVGCLFGHHALAQDAGTPDMRHFARLLSPLAGQVTVSKKPRIQLALSVPYAPESVAVFLDGMDISGQIVAEAGSLSYTPVQPLRGGNHVLSVWLRTEERFDLHEELSFATSQSERSEQLMHSGRISAEAERLLDRHESDAPGASYRVSGETLYAMQAAQGAWQATMNTNLWYLNQRLPVLSPQREGLDVASYLATVQRRGAYSALNAAVGDIQILGTARTINTLSRRGANLGFEYRNLAVNGFAVSSPQLFGFRGGTGIGVDADTNLYGFTAGMGFLDDRVRLRTIHSQGGESGSSFGYFSVDSHSRGSVNGYVVTAEPLPTLSLEAEYDQSRFDADSRDEVGSHHDTAYALRLAGQQSIFNYQASYERIGPDYRVIGGFVPSDQRNVAASGGVQLGRHSINAVALSQRSDVDNDPTRAARQNTEWQLNYSFFAGNRWLFSTDFRTSQVTGPAEAGFAAQDIDTQAIGGNVRYSSGHWSAGLQAYVSDQDDALDEFGDSRVFTLAFTPAYQAAHFSVVPYLVHNRVTFGGSGVHQDQDNASLMLNGRLLEDRAGYSLAAALYGQKNSDGTFDSRTRSTDLRLFYRFRKLPERPAFATVTLRLSRFETQERTSGSDLIKDWSLWLTASFSPQFSF